MLAWLPKTKGAKAEHYCKWFQQRLSKEPAISAYEHLLDAQFVVVEADALTDVELVFEHLETQLGQLQQAAGISLLSIRAGVSDGGIDWRSRLPQVLVNKELDYYRQPILSNHRDTHGRRSARIIYAETLVRVPTDSIEIPGNKVFAMVERFKLSVGFDKLILGEVLMRLDQSAAVPLGVNLSAAALCCASFHEWLWSILDYYQGACPALVLEIPETALISDDQTKLEKIFELIKQLYYRKVKVVIDQFGQNQQSLALLNQLPFFAVKLSRNFTYQIQSNEQQQVFLGMLLDIARSSQVQVFAEGVQDKAQFDWLCSTKIDGFQGFYICPLLRAERLSHWRNHVLPKWLAAQSQSVKHQDSA